MTSEKWHHVALVDSGSGVELFLDGTSAGVKAFPDPKRTTHGGFRVGGWSDNNRNFIGSLIGVRFYGSALAAVDLVAAMATTKPTVAPPTLPKAVSLYKGPILLGFDPRFQTDDEPPPTFAFDALAHTSGTPSGRLPPKVILTFAGESSDPRKVSMVDYGSVGLSGRTFQTWMNMSFPSAPPSAPFTKENPTRTFFCEPRAPPAFQAATAKQ